MKSQGKLLPQNWRDEEVNTESQLTRQNSVSSMPCGDQCSGRKTWRVTDRLQEAQCGQVSLRAKNLGRQSWQVPTLLWVLFTWGAQPGFHSKNQRKILWSCCQGKWKSNHFETHQTLCPSQQSLSSGETNQTLVHWVLSEPNYSEKVNTQLLPNLAFLSQLRLETGYCEASVKLKAWDLVTGYRMLPLLVITSLKAYLHQFLLPFNKNY